MGRVRAASSSSSSEEDGEIKDETYQHNMDDDRKAKQKIGEGIVGKGGNMKEEPALDECDPIDTDA